MSVVESFNFRGEGGDIFLLFDVSRLWRGGKGLEACFVVGFLTGYISISLVTAAYGSALTAGHFWQTPQK
ncbi:hypothetical protein C9422_14320 [Pseudomonas sp. B1(2018)]|nr:hypothetical protein C9422_14320 [Pseudomonas sp. B1(2018)]